ncbi:GNAT family N-acetyltransferase [Pararhizobium haloflavum]|uniref:GNAT family N-acetyltransferase n=1 Tax=Pararhizobium haloflavum TaxID=2037914 RepID=UPI000C17E410|nr:GNAT family N-acetyltransferase [Pararhizobium haloflavum]
MHVSLDTLKGDEIHPFIDDLARLRITVFRAFPYLYDGSADYEARYLATYARSPDSVFVLARDGDEIVGAATGMPMADETDDVRAPFKAAGLDPAEIFYFGESVLLEDYRGMGVGVAFFDEREGHARQLGRFVSTAFCAVQRPVDHPRRPGGYVPLDRFWEKRGYRPEPGLVTTFTWQDLDEDRESAKPMQFWTKRIDQRPR